MCLLIKLFSSDLLSESRFHCGGTSSEATHSPSLHSPDGHPPPLQQESQHHISGDFHDCYVYVPST